MQWIKSIIFARKHRAQVRRGLSMIDAHLSR